MDYKQIVGRVRHIMATLDPAICGSVVLRHGRGEDTLEADILALCDAVEALEKDRERIDRVAGYERMAQSSRITVICRSVPDANLFAEMLSDAISRTAASRVSTASTPTPAAPSDA